MPTDTRLIKLSVTSDLNCPWCYIGAKEVNRAIERARSEQLPVDFDIEYQPFMLDPTLPTDTSVLKKEHYGKRFGEKRFEGMQNMLAMRGKEIGINFAFGGSIRQTTNSHRLLTRAYQKGGQDLQQKLLGLLWAAYFEREEDIGNPDGLAKYAEEAGLMSKEETLAFLASDELKSEVQKKIIEAQKMGITGVPFTVIDSKWAVSGGQSADVFYRIFEKLAKGENP